MCYAIDWFWLWNRGCACIMLCDLQCLQSFYRKCVHNTVRLRNLKWEFLRLGAVWQLLVFAGPTGDGASDVVFASVYGVLNLLFLSALSRKSPSGYAAPAL